MVLPPAEVSAQSPGSSLLHPATSDERGNDVAATQVDARSDEDEIPSAQRSVVDFPDESEDLHKMMTSLLDAEAADGEELPASQSSLDSVKLVSVLPGCLC